MEELKVSIHSVKGLLYHMVIIPTLARHVQDKKEIYKTLYATDRAAVTTTSLTELDWLGSTIGIPESWKYKMPWKKSENEEKEQKNKCHNL
jgi:hypothetical protein